MSKVEELERPSSLTSRHDVEDFESGEDSLDEWLKTRALSNMEASASRTYVVCPSGSSKVVGYYAVCMGHILGSEVIGSMRRNMPRQIPSVILGRLAVDKSWHGIGLGKILLKDAVQRSLRASTEVSARLIVVHAISRTAELFYQHHGFECLPTENQTYALDLVKFTNLSKSSCENHNYKKL